MNDRKYRIIYRDGYGRVAIRFFCIEALNAALITCKDALWSIRKDRIDLAVAVEDLMGPTTGAAALEAFHSVQITLSAIDRLEVRGRDSAGLHVMITGHEVPTLLHAAHHITWCTAGTTYELGPPHIATQHDAFRREYLAVALGDSGP